ncbi:MAG: MFS transporter [Arachnia sp.]
MTSKTTLPLYLTATATSLFGNSAIAIVLPWLVLERTGDPAMAGLVAAVSAAPGAIAAFVGGHLVDKIGRRRMSVFSDVGSAVAVAALAIVDGVFGLNVGWFIALGVLGALFDVPGMTARETLMANVADASGVALDRVSALRGTLFGLSFLAGPAVAGWLLSLLPTIQVVWITAACSALAALAIAVMPLPRQASTTSADGSAFAGLTAIRRSAPLVALLVISLGSVILVGPLLSIVLPAHFTTLGSPGLLGVSLSAYAVGTIAGSGAYGWGFAGRRWLAWAVAHALYVVSGILIATLSGFWLVAAGMAAAGIASGLLQPITMVVLTTQIPDELRGRVFGAYSGLTMVVSPIGLGVLAAVLAGADLHVGAWVLAAGWVLVAAYALFAPGLKGYIAGTPAPRQEDLPHADHQAAG